MTRAPAFRLAGLVLAAVVAVGCGDDGGAPEVVLEDIPDTTPEDEPTTATTGAAASDLDACLADAGLTVAEPDDPDLPISAFEGSGPPIVNGAEGTGVLADGGAAVFFVYDTAAEADEAASLLGGVAEGTVAVVPDSSFPASAVDAIVDCAGGDAGGDAAVPVPAGEEDVEACITAGGVEITAPDAPDLVVTAADGTGFPVIDGVEGIGVRSEGTTAVIFVYETDEQASSAAQSFLESSDVEQRAPSITVVAFGSVLFAMDPNFPQDAQVVILDCADPR